MKSGYFESLYDLKINRKFRLIHHKASKATEMSEGNVISGARKTGEHI